MNEPDEKPSPPCYKWPWFVLSAVLLFLTLAILWMCFEVRNVEQERDVTAPLPAGGAH